MMGSFFECAGRLSTCDDDVFDPMILGKAIAHALGKALSEATR